MHHGGALLTNMTEVPYGKLLARNLRAARAAVGINQADVAERMNDLGYDHWRRQTVARVEKAQRRLTCDEALGLMVALETDLTAILNPAAEFTSIVLPGGQWTTLPAAKYRYNPERESAWDGNVCRMRRHPLPEVDDYAPA
jgi:transcriptional regulator with XRE-family HTH domain